ncbi:MAG: MoaD/ThiS family protein [Symbiobacteriaceae bacterium]|nr:MoaD/ThiS family protein [Symbiobacteriaceae bacterium]
MNLTTESITVHMGIRGHCAEYFPELPEEFTHQCGVGLTLRQVMVSLGINPLLIMGVVVNGKLAKKDYLLQEGDKVILLSPPTGG